MRKKVLFICALFGEISAFATQEPKTLNLENGCIEAVFDAKNGALIRVTDKKSGWEIMKREALGQSFEMLLPMEGTQMTQADRRYNVVKGIKQDNPEIKQADNKITFIWKGLKSDFMDQKADITFKGEVRLTDKGLEYSGEVINNSQLPIEYVSWPCIGEVTVPDKTQPLYHSTRNDQRELFPHFFNQHGYWGVDYPTSTYVLPEKSFLQVNDRERGFMVYHREMPKYMTITSFELIPGYEIRGVNPYEDEIDGEMVRIQFKANHIIFNKPGETSELDPIQFIIYKGDWTKGVDLYRNDRIALTAHQRDTDPKWLDSPLTWRKISIGNGKDLVRYGKEALKGGVDVLLVSGWYRIENGHVLEVLGLEDAITECQSQGIRVVLETNWITVDRHSAGYRENFRKYVMVDPFDMPYNFHNICPNTPNIQKWVKSEWLKLPALHMADGYMNSDFNHNNKSFMCFDKFHQHRLGEPTLNGIMKIDAEMAKNLAGNTEKVALGQGFVDYQNDIYNGYLVNASDNFYALHRYMDTLIPIMLRVEVRNARKAMNEALLNRMNIVYDLNFFNDNLEDYPNIVKYGNQIEDLRNKYAGYLWNATFNEHHGASVQGNNLEYAVFITKSGKRAVVVVNKSVNDNSKAEVVLDNGKALVYATPESQESKTFNGSVELAPLSAVVIMEK